MRPQGLGVMTEAVQPKWEIVKRGMILLGPTRETHNQHALWTVSRVRYTVNGATATLIGYFDGESRMTVHQFPKKELRPPWRRIRLGDIKR